MVPADAAAAAARDAEVADLEMTVCRVRISPFISKSNGIARDAEVADLAMTMFVA